MAHRYAIRKVERGAMDQPPISREEYVRQVLEAYCHTSGTTGTVRRPDRLLAAQLHQRGVPLTTVENALILAAARRLLRSNTGPAAGDGALLGLLPSCNRGNVATQDQGRVLPIHPPQTPALQLRAHLTERPRLLRGMMLLLHLLF